jgi:hypothetical protein
LGSSGVGGYCCGVQDPGVALCGGIGGRRDGEFGEVGGDPDGVRRRGRRGGSGWGRLLECGRELSAALQEPGAALRGRVSKGRRRGQS